jgi:hypothetical protein
VSSGKPLEEKRHGVQMACSLELFELTAHAVQFFVCIQTRVWHVDFMLEFCWVGASIAGSSRQYLTQSF